MDPLSIVASTISILEAASKTYNTLLRVRGIPREFAEVERTIPLAEDVLRKVHGAILGLDDQSRQAIQPTASDCQERATKLRDILDRLNNDRGSKENSALDVYRKTLRRLGKSHRVESLMSGLLRGLDKLAQHQLFATATEHQLKELQSAIEKLGKIESSVPDSDLDGSAVYMEQHIAQGGTGQQMQIGGEGHHINTGSAPQYISGGGNMYFGVEDAVQASQKELEKKRMAILQLLTAAADHRSRKDRNPPAVQGTCSWFMNHPYFTKWRESGRSEMLFVSANPGCGKSVLANHLVNKRLGDSNDSRIICHYFFKDDFEDQKNAKIALQCILLQLFSIRDHSLLSGRVIELFDMAGVAAVFSLQQLWEIFITTIQQDEVGEVVCLIDAYDECSSESGQKELLSALLRDFYASDNEIRPTIRLKFLITSRFNMKTKQDLRLGIEGVPIIFLQGESNDKVLAEISAEVNLYIDHEVSLYRQNFHLTNDAAVLILEKLKAVENRTYLWVYLTFKYIDKVAPRSKEEIREATASLPETVYEAYEKILKQSHDILKAKKLLHIIVAAERPLTIAEMQIAMAIRETDGCYADLNDRLVSEEAFRESINSICSLFITIFEGRIYLIHQTAKEFLVSDASPEHEERQADEAVNTGWKSSLRSSASHHILAKICLIHLTFIDIEINCPVMGGENVCICVALHGADVSILLQEHLVIHPFLAYSSRYWSHHFHRSDVKESSMLDLLMYMCDASTARCQTWFRIFWSSIGTGFPIHFTTTMIAAYFGLPTVAKTALRTAADELKRVDGTYKRSALSWAAENGCEEVIKVLLTPLRILTSRLSLQNRLDIDGKDIFGRTALSYAAWRGHTSIAKRLIYAGASVNATDRSGCSPLQYAFCAENIRTVKALAQTASKSSVEIARQELLISAAVSGNQTVVCWLLEQKTPIESVNKDGFTALWEAMTHSQYATARTLLKFGAATDTLPTKHGSSILCFLAQRHREHQPPISVYNMLLDAGAVLNATDDAGCTALLHAAYHGHAELIDTLYSRGANLNATDRRGRTALMMAVSEREHEAAQKLLNYGVDVDTGDADGVTALMTATMREDSHMVQQLLDHNADVSVRDTKGVTALSIAADYKNSGIIGQLFLTDAEIARKNDVAHDALFRWATEGDNELVSELTSRIRRFAKDNRCPPLHLAVKLRQHVTVEILSITSSYNMETRDANGDTALEMAMSNDSWECVRILVRNGASTEMLGRDDNVLLQRAMALNFPDLAIIGAPNRGDMKLKTVDISKTMIVALNSNDVDQIKSTIRRLGASDELRSTMRQVLCDVVETGDASRVETLLIAASKGGVKRYMHFANSDGHTALWLAVNEGHDHITRVLLTHGAPVNMATPSGRTPLHLAAARGYFHIVQTLLGHGATIEVFDKHGHTPLWLAVQGGRSYRVVEELLRRRARLDVRDLQGQMLIAMAESLGSRPMIAMLKRSAEKEKRATH